MKNTRDFLPWVVFERCEDMVGWTAHVLDFDLITHGTTLRHASEMALESTLMTIEDDLMHGLDPERRKARTPNEAWERCFSVQEKGERLESGDVDRILDEQNADLHTLVLRYWVLANLDAIEAHAGHEVGDLECDDHPPMIEPTQIRPIAAR